jgi:hypothetical protein
MEYKNLSITFGNIYIILGIPKSTLSRTIKLGEKALADCLKTIPEAFIIWPTFQKQHEWAFLTQLKHPILEGRWGFVDGKNYNVQKPSNSDLQNSQYNGKW